MVPYVSACLRDGIMTGSGGFIRPNDTITRAEAVAHGLINGLPGNLFDASGTLTRAQAATVLSKAIDLE